MNCILHPSNQHHVLWTWCDYIRAGYYTDLTVFDEAVLRSAPPDQELSFGIEKVFVNEEKVLDGDQIDRETLKTAVRALPVK